MAIYTDCYSQGAAVATSHAQDAHHTPTLTTTSPPPLGLAGTWAGLHTPITLPVCISTSKLTSHPGY